MNVGAKVIVLACLAFLGGCGSDGPMTGVPMQPSTSPPATVLQAPGTVLQALNAVDAAGRMQVGEVIGYAAENKPVAGSVTQSSNGSDSVEIEVTRSGGSITYTLSGTMAGQTLPVSGSGRAASADELSTTETRREGTDSTLYVLATTNIQDDAAQWAAFGIWANLPNDFSNVSSLSFGAFANSSDPFDQADLPAVTGTATYEGDGTGIYVAPDSNDLDMDLFDAQISLTADFGNGTDLGTISGRISDFTLEDDSQPDQLQGVVMELSSADIGSGDSGFFTGATSMTLTDRVPFRGSWGGQFAGNGEGSPTFVIGTFGGAAYVNDVRRGDSFIGTFMAER